jgi:hypothetical protein
MISSQPGAQSGSSRCSSRPYTNPQSKPTLSSSFLSLTETLFLSVSLLSEEKSPEDIAKLEALIATIGLLGASAVGVRDLRSFSSC